MKHLCVIALTAVLLLGVISADAEEPVWQLIDEQGSYVTSVVYEPEIGDIYIAEDNHSYSVVQVEEQRAILHDDGRIDLPGVSWLDDLNAALPVSSLSNRRRIALYCTHSDESYEPTDGTYSNEERGSIYQVAQGLAERLSGFGIECELSDALHHPHDAGAYRRSRQTAIQLVKNLPDAIFDIHRDGIPDPKEYALTLGGKKASKIRLLVGRGNQNMEVNKDFALLIKAVADKTYPGLIKDIYMGRGVYNQDLLPKSLLFECGTYTMPRESVMNTLPYLATVISRSMYGEIVGSAGATDLRRTAENSERSGGITEGEPDYAKQKEAKDSARAVIWLIVLLVSGLAIYGILSAGSLRGGIHKAGRHISEMTGGLLGKKPHDDQ